MSDAPPQPANRGTLITVAPAACPLGHLLRTAIDAEQVGATRLHLAADQPEPQAAIRGIREHTGLVVTADPASPAHELADPIRLAEVVLDESADLPALVRLVADTVAAHPGGVSIGGRGASAPSVLLAALAAGAHLRVGTADTPVTPAEPTLRAGRPESARDDSALAARAGGLARIAGRPPLGQDAANSVLGLS